MVRVKPPAVEPITLSIPIPAQRIADLVITAFEGGSNYWLTGAKLTGGAWAERKAELEQPWYSDKRLYLDPELRIQIEELYDERKGTTRPRLICRANIERGFRVMGQKYGRHLGNFLAENDDATTADVWLQCVALGKLVYG